MRLTCILKTSQSFFFFFFCFFCPGVKSISAYAYFWQFYKKNKLLVQAIATASFFAINRPDNLLYIVCAICILHYKFLPTYHAQNAKCQFH